MTDLPQPTAKYGADGRQWWLLGLYLVFFTVMWSLFPRHLGTTPAAVAFADAMGEYIPMLDQIKKIPGYDPFTRLFYAVQWAFMPLVALYGWVSAKRLGAEDIRTIGKLSTRTLCLIFICCLSGTLMAFVWPINESYISWRSESLVSNVFGIGHFGVIMLVMFFWSGTLVRRIHQRIKSII